jgi:hypothetical protein
MTKGIRWRIIVLQVGLIGILSFAAGFLFWGNSFSHGMVRDQVAAQQIYFPAAGSAALDPKVYPTLQQYAGQQLLNGYGWWQVGQYAFYAAIGVLIAAIVVLGALLFELGAWRVQVRAVRPTRVSATPLAVPRPAGS